MLLDLTEWKYTVCSDALLKYIRLMIYFCVRPNAGILWVQSYWWIGANASLLGSFCLKDRCGLSPCNGRASCPEGCMAKLLHASKTGDNLLSNGPHQLKQGLLLRLNRLTTHQMSISLFSFDPLSSNENISVKSGGVIRMLTHPKFRPRGNTNCRMGCKNVSEQIINSTHSAVKYKTSKNLFEWKPSKLV